MSVYIINRSKKNWAKEYFSIYVNDKSLLCSYGRRSVKKYFYFSSIISGITRLSTPNIDIQVSPDDTIRIMMK
jgi:hypothetical protein